MNNIKILFCLTFICFIAIIIFGRNAFNSDESDKNDLNYFAIASVDESVLQINLKINQLVKDKAQTSYLSNPYVIVTDMPEYNDLVSQGVIAIKPLYDKINNSTVSGLIEYICAMAIEEIMSQKFSYMHESINEIDYDYGWANSKEFGIAFSDFMKKIPNEYNRIKSSLDLNEEEKINEINDLGLGVIPYIIEDINNSKDISNYKNMLLSILKDKNQIDSSNVLNFNLDNWINTNYNNYLSLNQLSK